MEWIVGLAAGLVAGFINTVAGSGSFLTLPALIFLGLPAQVANGTNRIGILVAGVVAVWSYRRRGLLQLSRVFPLLPPVLLGSVLGALLAVDLPASTMDLVVGVLMSLMLLSLVIRPRLWLDRPRPEVTRNGPLGFLVFFAIGVYGGFIQAGVGLFLLSGLVLVAGFDLVRANGIKALLVLLFTLPATLIFLVHDQVVLSLGLLMAAGQAAGAYLAVHFAARAQGARDWIRWLLIVVLAATALKLFGVLP